MRGGPPPEVGRLTAFAFTQSLRDCLAMARHEASRLRHGYVGSEHLLLGLLHDTSTGGRVLAGRGVEGDELRRRLLEIVRPGTGEPRDDPDLPYTSRAKAALEQAMRARLQIGSGGVGTEHLLLGILADERSIATQVLSSFGLTAEAVRAELRRLADDARERSSSPAIAGTADAVATPAPAGVPLSDPGRAVLDGASSYAAARRQLVGPLHLLAALAVVAAERGEPDTLAAAVPALLERIDAALRAEPTHPPSPSPQWTPDALRVVAHALLAAAGAARGVVTPADLLAGVRGASREADVLLRDADVADGGSRDGVA